MRTADCNQPSAFWSGRRVVEWCLHDAFSRLFSAFPGLSRGVEWTPKEASPRLNSLALHIRTNLIHLLYLFFSIGSCLMTFYMTTVAEVATYYAKNSDGEVH
jgi:hypothetical protein